MRLSTPVFASLHAALFLGALVGWLSALDEAARDRRRTRRLVRRG